MKARRPRAETPAVLLEAREVRADDPNAREAWRVVAALSPKRRRRAAR